MNIQRKIWVAVYAAGVMAGILYANLIAQESIMQMGIFAENHLTRECEIVRTWTGIYMVHCAYAPVTSLHSYA